MKNNTCLRLSLLILIFLFFSVAGCLTNHFTGEGDHQKTLAQIGEVPENVPLQKEFKTPLKVCKKSIRRVLQEDGAGIASISNEFIKTEKTLLRSAGFGEAVLGGGQVFYVFEISLCETSQGTMVEPVAIIYQKGSITKEEVVKWPKVSNGLRHEFFQDLSQVIN
ncbi:MAG: hypothetical protein KAQ63_02945 [Candidatus Moranbacteria bacterium]|nr:hypothetical protein [Candidatus Moranbacteria bacterium]